MILVLSFVKTVRAVHSLVFEGSSEILISF